MAEPIPKPPDGNTSRGPGLLAEEIILTTIALLTTVVRVGVRVINRQTGWDDATITAAMLFRLISFSFTMVSLAEGNGRHEYYLEPDNIINIIKWTWANEVLIFVTVCLIKVSICLYIFRIKKTGWLRWFLWGVIIGLVLTNGSCVIVLFAQCQPLRAFWDREPGVGTCWSINIYNTFIYVSVGYSILTDLICTALPVVILWNVQVSRKLKYAVCGLMTLGLIASGCAAGRAALSVLNQQGDLTYSLVQIDEWAFAEADVGIIAANVALGRMIWLFVHRWRKPEATQTNKATKGSYGQYNLSYGSRTKQSPLETIGHSSRSGADSFLAVSLKSESDKDILHPDSSSLNPYNITRTFDIWVEGQRHSQTDLSGEGDENEQAYQATRIRTGPDAV